MGLRAKHGQLHEALKLPIHTLGRAHWADHNDREEGSHSYTAAEWDDVVAEGAAANTDVSAKAQ